MQMINKLLYRSRQRGFLELDLLVGLWAEQEVPKMDTAMLQQFAVVLDQARTASATDLCAIVTARHSPE
jgi:succinate dehydrogenase flavin-adding protein (antitoxin of CptAB toxin-antitoxin module)